MSHHARVGVLKQRVSHSGKTVQRVGKTSPGSAMLRVSEQFLHERMKDLAQAQDSKSDNPCEPSANKASNAIMNEKLGQGSSSSMQEPSSVQVYKEIYQK